VLGLLIFVLWNVSKFFFFYSSSSPFTTGQGFGIEIWAFVLLIFFLLRQLPSFTDAAAPKQSIRAPQKAAMLEAAAWYQQISFKWLSTSVLDSVFLNNLPFLSSNKQQLLLPHSESKASVHSRMHRLLVPKVWAALKVSPLPPPANLEHKGHQASVKLPP
jgi:hypothetical protein